MRSGNLSTYAYGTKESSIAPTMPANTTRQNTIKTSAPSLLLTQKNYPLNETTVTRFNKSPTGY
jgi:hypothetical protein